MSGIKENVSIISSKSTRKYKKQLNSKTMLQNLRQLMKYDAMPRRHRETEKEELAFSICAHFTRKSVASAINRYKFWLQMSSV